MVLVQGHPPPPPTTSSPTGSSRASPRPPPGTIRTVPSAASRRPRGPRQPWPGNTTRPGQTRGDPNRRKKGEGDSFVISLLQSVVSPFISHTRARAPRVYLFETRQILGLALGIDSTVCSHVLLVELYHHHAKLEVLYHTSQLERRI